MGNANVNATPSLDWCGLCDYWKLRAALAAQIRFAERLSGHAMRRNATRFCIRSARPGASEETLSSGIKVDSFLGKMPLFRELGEKEISRIADRTRQIRVPKGQILFHRGEQATGLYVVLLGQVKLAFVSARGDEKVVDIVRAGQSFGDAATFMRTKQLVTAQALVRSLLLYIPRNVLFEELKREPKFALSMIASLSRRLHHLMHDFEAHSMWSGTQRVIGYLLHARSMHTRSDGEIDLTLPTAKSVLASRLNLTRERFSRILHELTVEGLIKVNGRNVRVLDVDRLSSYDH